MVKIRKFTGRMGRLKNPVGVLGISDGHSPPFDLEVAGCLFEEWWSWEAVYIESGFWRHAQEWIEDGRLKLRDESKDRSENRHPPVARSALTLGDLKTIGETITYNTMNKDVQSLRGVEQEHAGGRVNSREGIDT